MKDKKVNKITLSTMSFKVPKITKLYIRPQRSTKQIRISEKLHEKLKLIASEDQITISKLVDSLVQYSLNKFYKGR